MARAAVYLQDACYKHQYIRTKDTSLIVERPERIRAVKVGVAGALAASALVDSSTASIKPVPGASSSPDDLASALERLDITQSPSILPKDIRVVRSDASIDLLSHPAVKFVHGDIERDVHIPRIKKLAEESYERIQSGESDIPPDLGWRQGDLYLCPESIAAMEGANGTLCEAIDNVLISQDDTRKAFVVIRPPGHHCGEDTPEGFCFVNNVAIGAAHAHLKHGVQKIVIFDIDLHHGNGTQSIVWQINEETYRQTLEVEGGAANVKPGPTIYYGSMHDVLSYPCEDGNAQLIQAASVSIHGAHGQYIENVHLEEYKNEDSFHTKLYDKYAVLLRKAEEFLQSTDTSKNECLFFISCGMDACEHEYDSMSRHNRRVPVSFYQRFTSDVCALADKWAGGKVVSVLEGGYSDRALISGTMAHVLGLAGHQDEGIRNWWSVQKLERLEKATKPTKRRNGKQSITPAVDGETERWIEQASQIFSSMDEGFSKWAPPPGAETVSSGTGTGMRLRERPSRKESPTQSPQNVEGQKPTKHKSELKQDASGSAESSERGVDTGSASAKLPRVILKLGPRPTASD